MAVNNNATSPSTNQPQPAPSPAGMGGEEFFNILGGKLLEQGGIISSTASNLEQNITNAIGGIRESAAASNQRIESVFGREIQQTLEGANETMISGRAAGSGGLMNIAALRELTTTTDKQLNDLKQRKEELILQNNAEAASKIADLELKTLEFRLNAQQKTFENLLGMGNFGLSVAQEKRLGRAQTFEERKTINNIALEFGLDIDPNDTIETITAKAAPFASEERRARLAQTLAETRRINADIQRIQNEGIDKKTADEYNLDTMAMAYLNNPDILGNDVSSWRAAEIENRAAELKIERDKAEIDAEISDGLSKSEILNRINNDKSISIVERSNLRKHLDSVYKEPEKKPKKNVYLNTSVNRATGIGIGDDLYKEISRRLGF